MVQVVQDRQSDQLIELAPEPQADRCAVAVDLVNDHLIGPVVADHPAHQLFCDLVVDASEERLDVELQNVAVGSVFPVELPQVFLQEVPGVVCSFSGLARAVLVDEVPAHLAVQIIVDEAPLRHSIAEPGDDDVALLRFVDGELVALYRPVGSSIDVLLQQCQAVEPVLGVVDHALLPSYAFFTFSHRGVEVPEICDFFLNAHTAVFSFYAAVFRRRSISPFGQGGGSLHCWYGLSVRSRVLFANLTVGDCHAIGHEPIRVVRIVVVEVTRGIDIPDIIRIAGIRGRLC